MDDPPIDLKKEKRQEEQNDLKPPSKEANIVRVSHQVASERDFAGERAEVDNEVTKTKAILIGALQNRCDERAEGTIQEPVKQRYSTDATWDFSVNDPGQKTIKRRDIKHACAEEIFLTRDDLLLQITHSHSKVLQIEPHLVNDCPLNLMGDDVPTKRNVFTDQSQSENNREELKKPPAQDQVENNCLDNLAVDLTAAKQSTATRETTSEIIRDEDGFKEQNSPKTENDKHLEHLFAELLNIELKQHGKDKLNMTEDNKPLTEEFGNEDKQHGQINGDERTQDDLSFGPKPEPQALDLKSTEREKENAGESVAEKKIAQNEAPASKNKQERKNKKRRKRGAKASQKKRQGTKVKDASSQRQPSRGIDVKVDSKDTKPEADIPRKLTQHIPEEQEQDKCSEGAVIPQTTATHADIPEESPSSKGHSTKRRKYSWSLHGQKEAAIRLCTWAVCAWVFLCILCCPPADANPLRQKRVSTCETNKAVFDGAPSVIAFNFTHDLRHLQLSFRVLRYDFDGLDFVPETVLTCLWDKGVDHPKCISNTGYVLDESMTNTAISLTISHTTKENAGRYVWKDSLSSLKDGQECDLDVKGWDISCAPASPQAVVGASTSVTCQYNSNLQITREDFYIYRFAGDDSQPVKVADCKWKKNDTVDKPKCTVESGYELDKDFGTNVTLLIKSVDKIHAGKYTCNVLPYIKEVKVHSCALEVQEARIHSQPVSQIAATKPGTLAPTVSSRTSCGSKMQVVKGKTALLTCMIPEGIDSQTANISVEKVVNIAQPLTSAEFSEQVLSCRGNSSCEEKDGYRLIGKPGPTIQLQIPNVTDEHDGMYVCTFTANLYSETQMVCLQTVLEDTPPSGAPRLHPPMSGTKIAAHLATVIFLSMLSSRHILF